MVDIVASNAILTTKNGTTKKALLQMLHVAVTEEMVATVEMGDQLGLLRYRERQELERQIND